MQISFVMLLFSDQISGRGKSVQGEAKCLRGAPPCGRKPASKSTLYRKVALLLTGFICKVDPNPGCGECLIISAY